MASVADNLDFLLPSGNATIAELNDMLGGQASVPLGVALDRLAERKRKADIREGNRVLVQERIAAAFLAFAENPNDVELIAAALISSLEEEGILTLEGV